MLNNFIFASVLLYFVCLKLSAINSKINLLVIVPIFTFCLMRSAFGSYFISFEHGFYLNYWLTTISLLYFYLYFFAYAFAYKQGVVAIVVCAIFFSFIPYLSILIPLNPIICVYPYAHNILPTFNSPLVNLLILNVGATFVFMRKPVGYIMMLVFFVFLSKLSCARTINSLEPASRPVIAIVQVGLYYKQNENTSLFFHDLKGFLDKNKDVELVLFSENTVYGYKNEYNRNLTLDLIKNIKSSGLSKKVGFLFNFYGYNNMNNIFTVFLYNDVIKINQKKVLIPFVEKRFILNSEEGANSEYLMNINELVDIPIDFKNTILNTFICYDAIFPRLYSNDSALSVIQSDYSRLDNGPGYENVLYFGAMLSKFCNSVNGKMTINVQNYGGSIVIDDSWRVNMDIYEKSKNDPFVKLVSN